MTDHSLSRIAAVLGASTRVAAKAALKAAGLPQTRADDLLIEHARIEAARSRARRERIARRLGYCPVEPCTYRTQDLQSGKYKIADRRAKEPVQRAGLPAGSPLDRLADIRRNAVKDTLDGLIQRRAHGALTVVLTDDPSSVGIQCRQYYAGGSRTSWAAKTTDTTITVPSDWRARVQRRGLGIVNGAMTLDAAPIDAIGCCEVYRATWAARIGTKTVAVERGYIARSGGASSHGETPQLAVDGLTSNPIK